MPTLRCEVGNCVHNATSLCELGEIAVKGRDATHADSTCCSTFCDCTDSLSNEKTDKMTSSVASSSSSIRCSADSCKYNEQNNCVADSINVSGHGAQRAEHTVCSTFTCN